MPYVSSRFEALCVTLMNDPWDATEALDDWRLLFGEAHLSTTCLAAAFVLALYGSVGNPTAWETLRQHGLLQHAHAACSVGGGLLHRVCCLRRREAADVATLLLQGGACPAQMAYCPPTAALAVDERPIDCGGRPSACTAVRSANLETLHDMHSAHMLSPLTAAARWGHHDTLEALLSHQRQKLRAHREHPRQSTTPQRGRPEPVVRATHSTLLIPLTGGVTAVLTPLTGQMQFVPPAALQAASPALSAPPAPLHTDTLVHACVGAVLQSRSRALLLLVGALQRQTRGKAATAGVLTTVGCSDQAAALVCPLPRKGGSRSSPAARGGAVSPHALPRDPCPLPSVAVAVVMALPQGNPEADTALQCCLVLAAHGFRCSAAVLTHLRISRPPAHAKLHKEESWHARRRVLLSRTRRRAK